MSRSRFVPSSLENSVKIRIFVSNGNLCLLFVLEFEI